MNSPDTKVDCDLCDLLAKQISALRYEVNFYKRKLEQSQTERFYLQRQIGHRHPLAEQTEEGTIAQVHEINQIEMDNLLNHGPRTCGASCG
jgi:hypothetical protein